MEFAFTDEEERFRAELRAFLAEELPDWWRGMFVDDPRAIPFTRAFCRKLAARGWLALSWPREWGGQEAGVWQQAILREEMWAHDEPRGPQYLNLNYIRPIDSMAGPHELNEMFFDEVRVPRDCLLGAQGQGWEIVTTGLTFERVGVARYARAGRVIALLVEHVKAAGLAGDPDVRRKLAELRVRQEAARLLNYRVISLQARGLVPSGEAATARVHNTQLEQL